MIAVGSPKKVKGTLKAVVRPVAKVTADEPDSLQATAKLGKNVNPQITAQVEQSDRTAGKLHSGNGSVNAKGGLKEAISKRVFGKKKAKGISLAQ